MTIKTRKIVGQVLFILFAFYLDGLMKWAFLNNMNRETIVVLPQLMLMTIVMLTMRIEDRRQLIIYGIVFGVVYDSYYYGIIGLYTVLLPLVMVGIDHFRFLLIKNNMGYDLSVYFLALTFLQSGIYLLERLLQQTSTDVLDFITYTLGPTLLWNIVVFFILYIPIANLSEWLVKYRRDSK
ncbi:rod shape-determining protein MreD [Companilactobacillus alimentarius]|uniref:Rod shape-determining protein MreD n=1 Tax=Companilactobacillus alimentarius DSM 20249 TaxID=1423720 RepID=A0A2K9HEJ0_9LACO|nr:rod shape-determining protein MreD [Companilactobacillus alimentarius]AUI70969.1 rod shape-determining protein MreD [Companilactobacillus alimentarius DSM 20249]KRK75084.1 rod shape-determining protein MreD [Companilactobacillus alimentarius DSM 20249]MDT6951781.1 rod shape-determining protein MreD [Companilactobacillus alimentarius]GEO44143.1 rod shape-determining protein MreD [Companilactobacillus alimentarius]